jgi:hypothetical protein
MAESRSSVVSSFTIIKGSLIDETYAMFKEWDFDKSATENRRRAWQENIVAAPSARAAEDRVKSIGRRFDPAGRDRPLADLAIAGCGRGVWEPLLLFHMTRDEFLVRDFLLNWLWPQFTQGTYRLHTDDVTKYLMSLSKRRDIEWSGKWTDSTTSRVASGLLRIARDFGLLTGRAYREFTSYHLQEESFLYLLYALAESETNARRILESEDWRMFLMNASDVDRELLRLHQFDRVHYQVAGSLIELKLPHESLADYTRELCA